jgi:hypothetical protein
VSRRHWTLLLASFITSAGVAPVAIAATPSVATSEPVTAHQTAAASWPIPPTYAGIRVPDQPTYSVSARMLDDVGRVWRGRESVTFGNPGHAVLPRVWLRLWANGPDGCTSPRGIAISHVSGGLAGLLARGCTATPIRLDHALGPRHRGRVTFDFAINVPERSDRFGSQGGFTYLGNALPVLAIDDNAGWHLDPYTGNGEPFYTTVADFAVKLDHPSDVRVPSTGVSTDQPAGVGRTLTTSKARRVRDFAWAVGPYLRVTSRDAYGVRVNVWWNPANVTRAQALQQLTVARRAMSYDARAFGAYPYHESDVVLDEFASFGGMEYPGFVLSLPKREPVAHEITHNCWYGIVGDDEYRAPWLDESFTQYVTLRFLKAPIGGCDFDDYPPAYRLTRGMDFWDRDPFAYAEIVYSDGPCALAALEKLLNASHMDHLLRTYALAHRFGFSTTHAFKVAAQKEAGHHVDLRPFWRKWRIDG